MAIFSRRRPSPRLVAAGVTLRNQTNKKWPNRDRRSDGWIGDRAHQARVSDHNPDKNGWVHAIDIDHDFLGPRGGRAGTQEAELFANQLIRLAREGKDGGRLKYVIYNNRIASGTHRNQFWTWRKGNWGHTQHIHVSFTSKAQLNGKSFDLPIFRDGLWDGVVPIYNNVVSAEKSSLKNMAAWRVACRLKDLGFYKTDVLPVYKQGYPKNAVRNFQSAKNLSGSGSYNEATHKALFLE
jgi:hypothetical protein